jgi:hypothetical protein
MKLMDEMIKERVISKGVRPPRLSDLTPTDFFFCRGAKSNVYENKPRTLGTLKTAIIQFMQSGIQQDLAKAFSKKKSCMLMHAKKQEAVISSTTYSDTHFMQSVCTILCGIWSTAE